MSATRPAPAYRLARLARDTRAELDRIIGWWIANTPDPNGGFVGEIDAAGAARRDADKSVVLNTRLLWFFSEAYRRTGSPACLDLANRAADYVAKKFLDAENGGLFWMLDADGRPTDRRKLAYAQAFGAYAFAAHFAASGDRASLERAFALYNVLETHYRDRAASGYWEALGEDFAAVADMRLSPRDLNAPKSMNAHLHVLEAYTALYRAQPADIIRKALESALRLMIERICDNKSGHLGLFFDSDWRPLDDVVSFGHDIEASWLICEAAEALGDETLSRHARDTALRLAQSTLAEALGPHGEVFEERRGDGSPSAKRIWWVQAEGLVGFLNAYEMTHDAHYLDACERLWRFVQTYQIDREGGEWRASSALDAPCDPPELKAGPWKCPYHTARAMLEIERRATRLARGLAIANEPEARN